MKMSFAAARFTSVLLVLGLATAACGQLQDMVSKTERDSASETSTPSDNDSLVDASLTSASGTEEPSLRPFKMDGGHGPHEDGDGMGGKGHGHGHPPKGGFGGPRGHGRGHQPPPPIPADVQEGMKAADAKKDAVLGIDRAKVDEVMTAMKTDLDALRAVAVNRDDFIAQAKVIQDKYAAQLKTILPAFESLTAEQKARVKAIHDLQKGVIDACVARGADSASAACTAAKVALKANIEAP